MFLLHILATTVTQHIKRENIYKERDMAEGVLYNIVEDILKNLGSRALDEIASAWGFKDHLKNLKNTVNTIKDVLLDAEERQLQSHAIQGWLERLKEVVYVADDLFDKYAITASQKQTMSGKVKTFFSESNRIAVAFSISREIKKIREKLDGIVKDGNEFGLVVRSIEDRRVVLKRRNETSSLVELEQVIGRDEDKKAILGMLLDPHVSPCPQVLVIPIVGMGGLGKTTLAQLVYNDEIVEKNFGKLKLWVCVSDEFDIKVIVKKILMSVTRSEPQNLEMDQLQIQLREQIGGKKYLLVLDDVWSEDREEWLKLSAHLNMGKEGSRVLVTTRSKKVARIVGSVPPYALGGLSEEESWNLFRKMAFGPIQEHDNPELEKLGKEIVKQCVNVPLAIRALGSLLYGEDESKWLQLKEKSPLEVSNDESGVMPILKVSYLHLMSPLKNCFAYCALFPKDYEMEKEALVNLWMAEGFLIPRYETQSLEMVGEEYFLTLLERCFFQDVTKDDWGNIKSCKMHDLLHDLAKEVAGVKSRVAKYGELDFNEGIHHLSFGPGLKNSSWKIPQSMLNLRLRSLLLPEENYYEPIFSPSTWLKFISRFRCLRVLDLRYLRVTALPSSIGNLIQLRYLNLSGSSIEVLPDSITKLQRLQTLDLNSCTSLQSLPMNIKKLTNLRHLDNGVCLSLIHMPPGIGALTSLQKLPVFISGNMFSTSFKSKGNTAQLRDLKRLNDLRGSLKIMIGGKLDDPGYDAMEADLSRKSGLVELEIEGDSDLYEEVDDNDHDEALLEGLKPHPNLKMLRISFYRGEKLPSWVVMNNLCTSLPHLVDIELRCCGKCHQIPSFSQLLFLKKLCLVHFESVEHMESGLDYSTLSPSKEALFFPSLEELELKNMDSLRSWWKEMGQVDDAKKFQDLSEISFPSLKKLCLEACPTLKSMPRCPKVEDLEMVDVNEALLVLKEAATSTLGTSTTSSSKFKTLRIGNVDDFVSLRKECVSHLSSLEIQDRKLLNTSKLKDFFENMHSLTHLKFSFCFRLESIFDGLEHLTTLEKLHIWACDSLDLSPPQDIEDNDMPWKALKTLQHLELTGLKKLVAIPDGIQYLINLRFVDIGSMEELEFLPEWISCLTSLEVLVLSYCPKLSTLPEGFSKLAGLRVLRIMYCPRLTKRCRRPNGEDWPKIQHIPTVIIDED